MALYYCPDCNRLQDRVRHLEGKVKLRRRQAKEDSLGSSTPSSKVPIKPSALPERQARKARTCCETCKTWRRSSRISPKSAASSRRSHRCWRQPWACAGWDSPAGTTANKTLNSAESSKERSKPRPATWPCEHIKTSSCRTPAAYVTELTIRLVQLENNLAERDLRSLVVARRISLGSQSLHGAHTGEVLITVLHTLRKQSDNPAQTFHAALGQLAVNSAADLFKLLFPRPLTEALRGVCVWPCSSGQADDKMRV